MSKPSINADNLTQMDLIVLMKDELERLTNIIDPVLENGISISGLATMNRARLLVKRANENIRFWEHAYPVDLTLQQVRSIYGELPLNKSRKKTLRYRKTRVVSHEIKKKR